MATDDMIRDNKLQHDINREATKVSEIDKYEYPTGNEILLSDKNRIIEQAKLTFFDLEKAFAKQIKTIKS